MATLSPICVQLDEDHLQNGDNSSFNCQANYCVIVAGDKGRRIRGDCCYPLIGVCFAKKIKIYYWRDPKRVKRDTPRIVHLNAA